jgi:integrase
MGVQQLTALHTVDSVIDWYETHEIREFSPVALKERRRLWGLFRAQFGSLLIEECRPAYLLDFIVGQKGAKSNHTRRRFKATISKPFNDAAQLGMIARNPFAGLKIAEGPCGRDWTFNEYRAILRHCRAYFRRLVMFIRFSGARPGEARELEWSHVRDEIQAIVKREHKTSRVTGTSRRIYFNVVLLKLIAWLRRHKTSDRWVFTNARGRPWTIKALTKHFQAIRARAGLPYDCKPHGGRHTFATHALMNGVDIATLAELLGHKDISMTQRYQHLVHHRQYLNDAMQRAIRQR